MAKKRRISDGASYEEMQALVLKCTRQLRELMPAGADLSELNRIEAEVAWLQRIKTWLAARPKRRNAIFYGSRQIH
jgi:hypothetical protein